MSSTAHFLNEGEAPAELPWHSVPSIYSQDFSVPFTYRVAFTSNAFSPRNPLLAECLGVPRMGEPHRCLFFVDAGLAAARPGLVNDIIAYAGRYSDRMRLAARPVTVTGGESVKVSFAGAETVLAAIQRARLDRHSFVIGVGGGAFLDAVGFAAAIAHRGVRHIRLPSTVLAQNDSGIGVKNGLNIGGVKNAIGTFAPPYAVVNDFSLLDSLPVRERISGMAEAVKVALIRDGAFFSWIEANAARLARFEAGPVAALIENCALLHMRQIAQGGDPFEFGTARPLDFGHWSAHKLEALSDFSLRHGEAVAIGIAIDARYSVLAGYLEPGNDERIGRLLERLGFRLWHPALSLMRDGKPAVLDGLQDFREHLGGELTVTILSGIGMGIETHSIDEDRMRAAIAWLRARAR